MTIISFSALGLPYDEDNISETEFSVEELASSLNISRSYFYKKMIKITGKKPIEFIRTIRMKRAQQLLTESQMQVSEIAYEVVSKC